jgi:hypothetical protein
MAQRTATYGSRTRGDAPRSRVRRFTNVGQVLARVFIGYKLISLREKRKGTEWGEPRRVAARRDQYTRRLRSARRPDGARERRHRLIHANGNGAQPASRRLLEA